METPEQIFLNHGMIRGAGEIECDVMTMTNAMNEYAELYHQSKVKNLAQPDVSGSLPLIEFIEEIEYMMKLYGNQRYTQAEAQRDKLAEKLDDIMRLGGNDR